MSRGPHVLRVFGRGTQAMKIWEPLVYTLGCWGAHGRPQKIFQEGNVDILLIFVRLLTIQCKWTCTKCFYLSTLQRKCPVLRQESQKCASLTAWARYITIIYTIGYLQIFREGQFFSKKHCQYHGLERNHKLWLHFTYVARPVSVTSKQELQTGP